jgi:hypothetical protein
MFMYAYMYQDSCWHKLESSRSAYIVKGDGVAQVVEHLPNKLEALSSNQYHQKTKRNHV